MKQRDWYLIALLVAFVALAGAYSIINPIHEGTDELRHYRFVRYVVENGRLPVQGQEACRSQSHHPPLIYLLGAAATWGIDTGRDVCSSLPSNPFWGYRYWEVGTDNKNMYLHDPTLEGFPWHGEALAAHIVRFINVVVGALTVWLVYATAREIWPRPRGLAVATAALLAFNPMFLYMSGTINNDVIAALSGALVLYLLVRLLHDEQGLRWRWGVGLGLAYVLALMSKFNLAPIILLIEVGMGVVAWRKRQWGWWWELNLVMGLLTLYGAGWWFGRNYYYYGEPTGVETLTELWGARAPSESFWLAVQELPNAWSSLWGRFGFGQIPLPQAVYGVLWWLALAAVSGPLVLWLVNQWEARVTGQRPRPALAVPTQQALGVALLQVVMFAAVLFSYMLISPAGAMGRFFFPGLPALVVLMVFGLTGWTGLMWGGAGRTAERAQNGLAAVLTVGVAALGVLALTNYLAPAYAHPPRWSDAELAAVPHPTDIWFDQLVRLRGYDIQPDPVAAGEKLTVRLYWEVMNQPPGDYLLFVHLIDEAGTMVTQRDTHPGAGKFPASQWRQGDRFVDTISLTLPETAYPAAATLFVGLYVPDGYRLGVRDGQGQGLGDAYAVAQVDLVAQNGRFPNPQDANFENGLRLVGYEYSGRVFAPGQTVMVTLYWEVLDEARLGYLRPQLRPTDSETAVADAPRQGNILTDIHHVTIPPTAAEGEYVLDLYLFDIFTQNAVIIVAEDGHQIDNHLQLAKLQIVVPNH